MSIAGYIQGRKKKTNVISKFAGINENIITAENEFADMTNMASDNYPAISTRQARGTVKGTYSGIKGFYIKNGKLFYIAGGKAYYDGTEKATVTSDEPKLVVGMGAYIVVWPDKFMLNTSDGTVTQLEATYTQSTDITLEPLSYGSAYTKINATGIDDTFSAGDNAKISNCPIEDYNTTKIISETGDDYIVVVGYQEDFDALATGLTSLTVSSVSGAVITLSGTITSSQAAELAGRKVFVGSQKATISSATTSTVTLSAELSINPKSGQKITSAVKTVSYTSGGTNMTFERKCPDLDFLIERDNRLWGCSSDNHEIYCCKLGDPKNWYNYEGLADDAYAATIASDGDFTGIGKYSSYLIFFKEDRVHILRGTNPTNFSVTEKEMKGVKTGCSESIVSISDVLYYCGSDGMYAFNGGQPGKISENLLGTITEAVCETYKNRLYVSCKYNGSYRLLVFDSQANTWLFEDTEQFKFAQNYNGELNYIDGSDRWTTIYGTRTETVAWSLESADLNESSIDMKYISKIRLNVMMDVGSICEVFAQFDGGDWIHKGQIRSTAHKTYNIPITPQRCSKWRYRLTGSGGFSLLAVSRDTEGGSEYNGSVSVQYRH